MKLYPLIFVLSVVCFIFPGVVGAISCSELTQKINADIGDDPLSLAHKHYPWMNLSWLERELGHGRMTRDPGEQVQYKWQCPENVGASLTVMASKKGKILEITGKYSSEKGAGLFSADFRPQKNKIQIFNMSAQSVTSAPTSSTQTKTMIAKMPPALANGLAASAVTDAMGGLPTVHDIAVHMKECLPGIYHTNLKIMKNHEDVTKNVMMQMKMTTPPIITTTIHGMKDSMCRAEVSVLDPKSGDDVLSCLFPSEMLILFTDRVAEDFSQGRMTINNHILPDAEKYQCKYYIDGKLISNL